MQLAGSSTGMNYWQEPGAFYINGIVKYMFSEKEQETYQETVRVYDSCFQLAKQNKIPEAQLKYHECCEINKTISRSLLDLVLAFYGQRLCYYHYKLKAFDSGISLTKKIIISVNLLQEKGHKFLFFGKIQQHLNLSRIYFEMNEISTAISLCRESMVDMFKKAGQLNSDFNIDGVSENELIEITQYGMMVEVLTDTCKKILLKLKGTPDLLEKAIIEFMEPLSILDFSSLSENTRYRGIDKFISLMLSLAGYRELQDDEILFFLDSPDAHNKMLVLLNSYIAAFSQTS